MSIAANCTSESYDPDPYDATPPVTVEFEYVTPHVNTEPSRRDDLTNFVAYFERQEKNDFRDPRTAAVSALVFPVLTSILIATPLRR